MTKASKSNGEDQVELPGWGPEDWVKSIEQKHEMITTFSAEVIPGVLQTEQGYIGKWREAIETKMNIRHSETYRRPAGARCLMGSTLAPMCKSRYPVRFVELDVKSTRTIADRTFSVPKRIRLAIISHVTVQNVLSSSDRTKEEFESILGKKFME